MLKRGLAVIIVAVVLLAMLFLGVKLEVVRPNMIFVPNGVKGVDISEHQGAVDFKVLSDAGIEFVYAKATEGATHVDAQFAVTCEQISGSRVALGAYHFFRLTLRVTNRLKILSRQQRAPGIIRASARSGLL